MRKASLVIFLGCVSPALQAQELTLFEPVDADPVAEQVAGPQPFTPQNGQPAFTVRSTMRVGDSFRAVLIDRSGQSRAVTWQPGELTPVEGYDGFTIKSIDARSVALAHPASDPCVIASDQGVSCQDSSTSLLQLSTAAAPLPPTLNVVGPQPVNGIAPVAGIANAPPMNPFEAAIQAQAAMEANGGVPVPVPGVQQGAFVNPFTGQTQVVDPASPEVQQLRATRQQARQERLNRMEPQRIPADQVPAGMRVVTTPFGDRLVPIRQ